MSNKVLFYCYVLYSIVIRYYLYNDYRLISAILSDNFAFEVKKNDIAKYI
jgi:hypothetical protein